MTPDEFAQNAIAELRRNGIPAFDDGSYIMINRTPNDKESELVGEPAHTYEQLRAVEKLIHSKRIKSADQVRFVKPDDGEMR